MQILPKGLFARLLVTNLVVVGVAASVMLLVADWLSPAFYRGHVQHMVEVMGPMGLSLRADLESGLHDTLIRALMSAFPIALVLSALVAYLFAGRISGIVKLLVRGAQEIARGHYKLRLSDTGGDELSELARQFNRLSQALEQVEQRRVELISSVAHELRTPLAALQGYSEALADGVLPAEEAAHNIAREVRAMGRLVEDLSLVSRVEAGAVVVHPEPLSAEVIINEARERLALAFAEKGLTLNLDVASDLPKVQADPERLHQVLSNLLSNALRYTPQGGQVVLGAKLRSEGVYFFVRDTGKGIPPEHQERIFERFYRVDPARSRKEGGTGVGLTVAKGLVEAMGGQMGLESTSGVGSIFWFSLPVAKGIEEVS
ncbi:MAG: sensor histidine kinase [Deinococcota bacterium]